MYASKPLCHDPANRLAVLTEAANDDYSVWLKNDDDRVVMKMNSLDDVLQVVPLRETREMPRRSYIMRRPRTSK